MIKQLNKAIKTLTKKIGSADAAEAQAFAKAILELTHAKIDTVGYKRDKKELKEKKK